MVTVPAASKIYIYTSTWWCYHLVISPEPSTHHKIPDWWVGPSTNGFSSIRYFLSRSKTGSLLRSIVYCWHCCTHRPWKLWRVKPADPSVTYVPGDQNVTMVTQQPHTHRVRKYKQIKQQVYMHACTHGRRRDDSASSVAIRSRERGSDWTYQAAGITVAYAYLGGYPSVLAQLLNERAHGGGVRMCARAFFCILIIMPPII